MARAFSIIVVARLVGVSEPVRTILTVARAISIIVVAGVVGVCLCKNGERDEE